MGKQSETAPFAQLGDKLKHARHTIQESLAEVAGAVEIGEEDYRDIESGIMRPSEEILMLLIQHFAMQDEEAMQLWELAGYSRDDDKESDVSATRTVVMAFAMDPRVVYSDQVQINGNKHGIVLNFLQPSNGTIPALPVARVGMSREQGKHLLGVLQETLAQLDKMHEPKQLPPPSNKE